MTFSNTKYFRTSVWAGLLLSCLALTTVKAQEIPYDVKVNYSLAAENFKNGDYASALPYLRWLLKNAPTLYNGERIHRRAVKTYEELAGATDSTALKVAYLDSALYLLGSTEKELKDANAEIDVAQWELDYGNFLIAHRNELPDVKEEAVDHFMKAYKLNPAETDPYYIRLIVQEYARLGDRDKAVNFMDDAQQHFQGNEELLKFFDEVRNQLFKSPEDREGYLEGVFAKDSTNVDVARELWTIYQVLEETKKAESMGEYLLELDPTTDTYRSVAKMKKDNGNYKASVSLYEQALRLAKSDSVKRDIEYEIAVELYDTGDLQGSRTHARRAISYDRHFGNADILIGDIYAKAVQESAFEREDKAVYWLAMDYYDRAREVDPSVANEAVARVQRYKQYMPTTEDKFFNGWKDGQPYKIDYGRYAWIDETTHVR
jgi:tetratricopeptide (TPR) repeat protein